MTEFILSQMDYIYFFYGIAFIILGLITFSFINKGIKEVNWKCLALFGLTHGVNELLDMTAYMGVDHPAFTIIRLVFVFTSFLCLFEFARNNLNNQKVVNISKYIYVLLIPLSLSGAIWGTNEANISIRYVLALPGGIMTAWLFLRIFLEDTKAYWTFLVVSVATFLYAVFAGLIVSKSFFFPASVINTTEFLNATGFPIQLMRGIAALIIATFIWRYFNSQLPKSAYSKYVGDGWIVALILTVILGGWLATYVMGKNTERELKQGIEEHVKIAAAAVNPRRLEFLEGNTNDYTNPDYIRLKEQLSLVKEANPNFAWLYLMRMPKQNVEILVDSTPKESPDFAEPGTAYPDAPKEVFLTFTENTPQVTPEYTDQWGTFVSGYAPILDIDTKQVVGVLGVDLSVENFANLVEKQRIYPITLTFFVLLLLMVFFLNQQKIREATEKLKYSEENYKQVADNLQKFKLAVDNVSDHIVITDADAKVLYANKMVEKITGFPLDEVMGSKAGVLWGKMMEPGFYKTLWNTIKIEKKTFAGEILNHRKNGEKYTAAAAITPIMDGNGNVRFFVGIERDITKAKEIDRMKSEFISLASHQLRTPLSAMRWCVEMLLNNDAGPLNKEQTEFVKNLEMSNQRMIDLVNSLLNVSRIESGRIIIDPQPTDIGELINDVLEELRIKLIEKKISPTVSIHEKLPKINVDQKLIRQVYVNLLTNAIKYTPEKGEINLFVSKKDKYLISQISDSGYGIPEKDKEKMFTKFYRGENIIKRVTDGNGLGLYLVKAIIESSNGRIWYESKEGKGTTFWFSLPMEGMQAKAGEVTIDS